MSSRYAPILLGLRPFKPEFFGLTGKYSFVEDRTKTRAAEWFEMRKHFPLTWFTAKEASLLLKVSTQVVYKLVREGTLKSDKYQGAIWIEPESLKEEVMKSRGYR